MLVFFSDSFILPRMTLGNLARKRGGAETAVHFRGSLPTY